MDFTPQLDQQHGKLLRYFLIYFSMIESCEILIFCLHLLNNSDIIEQISLQIIGGVENIKVCQMMCKNIYRKSCYWFMFDSTTNECKLFSGSINDLKSVCKEFGYEREPNFEDCNVVFDPNSENGCYVCKQFFIAWFQKIFILYT